MRKFIKLLGSVLLLGLIVAVPLTANADALVFRWSNNSFQVSPREFTSDWWLNRNVTPAVPEANPSPTQPETPPAPETTPTPNQPANPGNNAGLSIDEQQMVMLVNQERATAGLQPLAVDMQLVKLARMKSQDMIANNYFDHNSPTYGSPFEMMRANGIKYRTAGENLAGNGSVTGAHQALMNSSGHRANILNPEYTHIGIGIVNGGRYGKMFTQLFVGR